VQNEPVNSNSSQIEGTGNAQCFLSPRELSAIIGVEQATLAAWRRRAAGPTWYRIQGHLIRYDSSEVLTWIRNQRGGISVSVSLKSNVANLGDTR
jgi:hypothetical protein